MASPAPTYKHSAIIHKRGRFVVGCFNIDRKTHTMGSGPLQTCHAEVRAIRKALRLLKVSTLKGYSIYVCRVNKSGEYKLSKPCKDCQALIDKYGLKVQWTS